MNDADDLRALAGPDPAAQLRAAVALLLGSVGDTDEETVVATPHGGLLIEQFLAMALVEPVVHGWDLAAIGMYAPAVAVPATADAQQPLLGLLGRRD